MSNPISLRRLTGQWSGAAVLAFGLVVPAGQAETNAAMRAGAHSFALSVGAGEVEYEETVTISPVDSSWVSDYLRLDFAWTFAYAPRMAVRAGAYYWAAGADTETWTSSGALEQTNRLEVDASGLYGAWGYDLVRRSEADLTGWLGLGLRGQDFERSDFVVYGPGAARYSDTVGETYSIAFLSLGLEGWIDLTDELRGGARLTAGPVLFNEADNDLVGRVEGSGGYLVEGRVSLELALNPHHAVVIGAFYEEQSLEGDYLRDVAEWPDNTTVLWGIDLGWTYRM